MLPSSSIQTIRLPNHKPDYFKTALIYLYTGRVLLDDHTVFDMWTLCQELNLEELRLFCEDHITRSLSPDNACTLLVSALAREESQKNNNGQSFVERCIQYIGDNANECFQSPGFLRLSKDALIRLVSSDHLALEEVDIWRAVLNWARHQVLNFDSKTCWQLMVFLNNRQMCHSQTLSYGMKTNDSEFASISAASSTTSASC